MALNKYKLRDIVIPYTKKCGIKNLTPDQVSGINKDKEFFEPSNQVGDDTSNYKIVPKRFFACNLMHVGRDKVLPIAYNHGDQLKYVSPAYSVFSLKENVQILNEYFLMLLKSNEKDRYIWFHADSSVRDGMSWDDFCDINIELPDIPTQQKYVDIYNAMVANQQSYERGLEDLKLTIDVFLDEIKHKSTFLCVSAFLKEVDNRNHNRQVNQVYGINISKQFMYTVADTNGLDLENYKIVRQNEIAFSGMQTGRDKCIRIALNNQNKTIIISPAYTVFECKEELLSREYIMMWFSRKESDRRGWFMSDSSIRSNLDLGRFYEMQLPIPNIEIQKAIVDIYRVYMTRKTINEKLKAQINNICPILIRGSLEEK